LNSGHLKHIFAGIAGLLCLVIYILTLYPAVGFMDSGELAAAAYIFGIPHPTGYPLFLTLGYIVTHLPLPGSAIYKLNFLSALESAAAVVVTFYSAVILLRYVIDKLTSVSGRKQATKKEKKPANQETAPKAKRSVNDFNILIYVLAFTCAVCVGLAKTFWLDAIQVEVYALHSLFLSLIVLYSLRILTSIEIKGKDPEKKNWMILFLLIGFSFANHLSTIFIIPGLLYLFFLQYKSDPKFSKQLLPYVLLIIPGLLLYFLLVISSGSEPYLNWSDLRNISNLPGYLRGADYSQLMFSSSTNFSKNAGEFFSNLPGELSILPLIVSIVGIILLWQNFRKFVVFVLICVIFNLLYAFNYNIVDINTYYLLVFYLLGLILPVGVFYVITLGKPASMITGKDEPKSLVSKSVVVGLILVIFSVTYNYSNNNNSSNYANVDFTVNAINSVQPNSVLITYEWAYLYSASLYYQLVEKQWPDVKVFNIKFLAVNWYLKTIEKYYPELYKNIKAEAEAYISVSGQNEKVKAPKLTALVAAFIDNNITGFPVYVTVDMTVRKEISQFLGKYTAKPVGLVYKLEPKNAVYDETAGVNTLDYNFRNIAPKSKQEINIKKIIPGMYFETANYHYINKNYELSLKFIDKALGFDSGFTEALNLKNKILSEPK